MRRPLGLPIRLPRWLTNGRRVRRPWYFCLDEDAVPRYWEMVAVAVLSARERTTLSPVCLFDGAPGALTSWLRDMGVEVVHHRIGFCRDIEEALAWPHRKRRWELAVARGSFLRCEICLLAPQPLVLYTDVDVLFLADPPFPQRVDGDFAAAGEVDWDLLRQDQLALRDSYCNTGVMFIDTERYRRALPGFIDFCRQRHFDFFAYDQGAMNNHFPGRWQLLPARYNWRPFVGPPTEPPLLVHFHGPKPDDVRAITRGEANQYTTWVERFADLYRQAMERFDDYAARPEAARLRHMLGR
jgi:hypothetical protein